MRNIKIFKLLLMTIFALTIVACDDTEENKSVLTSFPKYPVTTTTAAVVAPEDDEGTYTFDFALDGQKQINPITLEVEVASNSTATEGVDFELSTHEFDFDALQGQDGFSLDITVLQDFEIEDGADETIYLTFKSTDPSGVENSQLLVVTIQDSGLEPQPGETADFSLSWAFTDPKASQLDPCDLDLDLTVQAAGAPSYGADILGNDAAGSACVEEGSAALEDMVDGAVYNLWVWIYGDMDYGDLSALTVSLEHSRENTSFNGVLDVEGVFDSRQDDVAVKIGTIERNGDVVTLKNAGGTVVSEGRISGYEIIRGVKKGM